MTFLGFFAVILASTHIYLFSRLVYFLQLSVVQQRAVAILLGGMAVLTVLSLPISRALPLEISTYFTWVVFPWMGIVLLMLVATIAADLVWCATQLLPIAALHDPLRLAFLQRLLGIAVLSSTVLLSGYSLWNGLRAVPVRSVTVTLDRLPKSMDGLRIVQITDLHIGPIRQGAWLKEIVDQVNALKPDLIAVTGDLVDGSVDALATHVKPMGALKAPLGVYFVTGNHEYYSGVESWCAFLPTLGLRVLRNERVPITTGDQQAGFDLAGIEDWRGLPDLGRALAGRDPNKMLLLLSHQPSSIDEAAAGGVDLQLSGHSHGGQIWPFTYLVYLQQPYVKGLHRHRDTATQIYVSQGTGTWGPPMRFGTEAEITEITLKAGKGF